MTVSFDLLIKYLIEGEMENSISEIENLLKKGVSKEKIVIDGIEKAMQQLDSKCTLEEFNLLEIMLAGRASMSVIHKLFPKGEIPPNKNTKNSTVILASLEGDVHDLGKNILKTILICRGYHVVDCGKDCSIDKLIKTALVEKPFAICISGLISPVISQVRKLKSELKNKNLSNIKVLAGGAALKMLTSEKLNVDYTGETVFDGENKLRDIQKEI